MLWVSRVVKFDVYYNTFEIEHCSHYYYLIKLLKNKFFLVEWNVLRLSDKTTFHLFENLRQRFRVQAFTLMPCLSTPSIIFISTSLLSLYRWSIIFSILCLYFQISSNILVLKLLWCETWIFTNYMQLLGIYLLSVILNSDLLVRVTKQNVLCAICKRMPNILFLKCQMYS